MTENDSKCLTETHSITTCTHHEPHETMNYLSYDVMSLLSTITLTAASKDDDDDENEVVTSTDVVSAGNQMTATATTEHHDCSNASDPTATATATATANHIAPFVFTKEVPVRSSTNSTVDDIEFQIRSTIHSWSFCWNRGDIVGYCAAYYDSRQNDNDARYVSVSRNGKLTTVIGYTNIQQFLTTVFQQCERHQSKVQQLVEPESSLPPVNGSGVAGYLEYHHLQVQFIPAVVVVLSANHNNTNDRHHECTTTATEMNHAIVFGHYTLEYSRHHHSNERGIFTLHLIQSRPLSSSSSSSKWHIQSEHSSAAQ